MSLYLETEAVFFLVDYLKKEDGGLLSGESEETFFISGDVGNFYIVVSSLRPGIEWHVSMESGHILEYSSGYPSAEEEWSLL